MVSHSHSKKASNKDLATTHFSKPKSKLKLHGRIGVFTECLDLITTRHSIGRPIPLAHRFLMATLSAIDLSIIQRPSAHLKNSIAIAFLNLETGKIIKFKVNKMAGCKTPDIKSFHQKFEKKVGISFEAYTLGLLREFWRSDIVSRELLEATFQAGLANMLESKKATIKADSKRNERGLKEVFDRPKLSALKAESKASHAKDMDCNNIIDRAEGILTEIATDTKFHNNRYFALLLIMNAKRISQTDTKAG